MKSFKEFLTEASTTWEITQPLQKKGRGYEAKFSKKNSFPGPYGRDWETEIEFGYDVNNPETPNGEWEMRLIFDNFVYVARDTKTMYGEDTWSTVVDIIASFLKKAKPDELVYFQSDPGFKKAAPKIRGLLKSLSGYSSKITNRGGMYTIRIEKE